MKPAVLEDAGGFFGAIPVAPKNVRTAHDDLIVFGELHFDSGNRSAHVTGLDRHARIIERADAGGFGESIRLQNGNAEHQEKLLRLRSERRGTADQRAKVRAESVANLPKDEHAAKGEPQCIVYTAASDVQPLPSGTRFQKQRTD